MNPLDQIMSVQDASKLWGLSPDRVKGMCQNGEVKAVKIGNSWVLDCNQPNPKKYRRNDEMKRAKNNMIYVTPVVEVMTVSGLLPEELQPEVCYTLEQAEKKAKDLYETGKYTSVFIQGHSGAYYNPRLGYEPTGKDWISHFENQ